MDSSYSSSMGDDEGDSRYSGFSTCGGILLLSLSALPLAMTVTHAVWWSCLCCLRDCGPVTLNSWHNHFYGIMSILSLVAAICGIVVMFCMGGKSDDGSKVFLRLRPLTKYVWVGTLALLAILMLMDTIWYFISPACFGSTDKTLVDIGLLVRVFPVPCWEGCMLDLYREPYNQPIGWQPGNCGTGAVIYTVLHYFGIVAAAAVMVLALLGL